MPSSLVFRGLATMPGYCTFRMDKPGVGDSEGDCVKHRFRNRAGRLPGGVQVPRPIRFHRYGTAIYILGISNGGGFAPLVPETDAEQAQVRGYVVVGGWVKTWFEHMIEIERRRFSLMGKSPGEVDERMKGAANLYHEWLIRRRPVSDILEVKPKLVEIWPEPRRSRTSLWASAGFLPAAPGIEFGGRVVAGEGSDVWSFMASTTGL